MLDIFKKKQEIKLYALSNSGSIYLEWLLEKNLKIELNRGIELGSKRRIAPSEDEISEQLNSQILFICLVKNPYTWLLSMHRRPKGYDALKELKFKEFIRYSMGDYRNAMEMWNQKVNSYLRFATYAKNIALIKYEELLQNPQVVLEKLSVDYEIKKKISWFSNTNQYISSSKGVLKQKFHADYYLRDEWIRDLNTENLQFINKFLDEKPLDALSYKLLK